SQLAIAAAWLALEDAGIDPDDATDVDLERAGVAMGTTSGEPREVEALDDLLLAHATDRVGPEFVQLYPCHVLASHIAAEIGFEGPNTVTPPACAAGNYAIAHAMDLLAAGRAELMLAGGADAFSRIPFTRVARRGSTAPPPG